NVPEDGSGLTDIKHDLADMFALFHALMRAPGFAQGEYPVHDGCNLASGKQGPDLGLQRRGDGALELDRTRTQRRTGMDQSLDHELGNVGIGRRTALGGNLDDAPLYCSRVVVAADIVSADHVEDDVDTLAARRVLGHGHKILL